MLKHNIDTEYDSWLLEQAQLLRDRNFQDLDIDNLVEEIEALVRGEKSSVEQFAYLIMLHLLLIEYWYEESEWNRNHWEAEITGFRLQLNNKLTTNLRNHLAQRLDFLYGKAYQAAVRKTKSSINGHRCLDERSRLGGRSLATCRRRGLPPLAPDGDAGSHRFPHERKYTLEDIIND